MNSKSIIAPAVARIQIFPFLFLGCANYQSTPMDNDLALSCCQNNFLRQRRPVSLRCTWCGMNILCQFCQFELYSHPVRLCIWHLRWRCTFFWLPFARNGNIPHFHSVTSKFTNYPIHCSFTCNRITMLVQYPSTISEADKCKHKFTFSSDYQNGKPGRSCVIQQRPTFCKKHALANFLQKDALVNFLQKHALATWNCLDLADSFNALLLLLAGSLEGPIVIAKRCN